MSKESMEHLSGLMDGELSRDAGLFLVRRLSADEEMCSTWERYHLIRDCIRQPGSKQLVTGLSVKLNASLESEQPPASGPRNHSRWLKPLSGLAIAASVAMVAIMVTAPQTGELQNPAGDTAQTTPVNQPFVSPNTLPLVPVSQAASFAPEEQNKSNRLNAYLLRHNQMARTAGRQGFVSFVPIVATPATTVASNTEDTGNSEATTAETEAPEIK